MDAVEALTEARNRILEQQNKAVVGTPIWRAHLADLMHVDDVIREFKREILKTPEEWCNDLDARILDYDGWRDGKSWTDPITKDEFYTRLMRCTIDTRGYPYYKN